MKEYSYITNQNRVELLKNLSAASTKKSQEGIYFNLKDDNLQLMYYPGYQYHRGYRGIFVIRFFGHLKFEQNSIILRGKYKMDLVGQIISWILNILSLSIIIFLWLGAFTHTTVNYAFFLPAIVLALGQAAMIVWIIWANKNYVRNLTAFMKCKLDMRPYFNNV